MDADFRTRCLIAGLLLVAWAALAYTKGDLPVSALSDANELIAYIKVLLGGIVGYQVGKGKS